MALITTFLDIASTYHRARIKVAAIVPYIATIKIAKIDPVTDTPGLTNLFFTKNPIRISIPIAGPNVPVVVKLQVEDLYKSGTYEDRVIGDVYSTVATISTSEVVFYPDKILDDILKKDALLSLPTQPLTDALYEDKLTIRKFKVVFLIPETEITTEETVTSSIYIAVLGKMSAIDYKLNNVFTRLATSKLFFTNRPRNGRYKLGSIDFLPLLFFNNVATVYFMVRGYFKNGSNDIIKTLPITKSNKDFVYPQFKFTDTSLVKIEVFLCFNSTGSPTSQVCSEVFTFEVVQETDYPVRQFIFRNQYGRLDSFVTTGRRTVKRENEKQTASIFRNENYAHSQHLEETYSVETSNGFVQNTGFMPLGQKAWFAEFIESDEVYEVMSLNQSTPSITIGGVSDANKYLVPINIISKKTEPAEDREGIEGTNATFEATYSL
jgi:hypothetical protein